MEIGITGAFGVPGENDNGRNGGALLKLCVGNICFEHRSLHKYTRVVRGQDGVEVKSMTDLDMLRYVLDVKAVREMERSRSDHHVVLCKVMLVLGQIKRREGMVGARRIRSEKLSEHQYREGYARSLEGRGVEWDGENNVDHM